ncbi:triple tyrosine motif-containing protein [Lachnospira eligens]|uniref:Triple tyrosine motif-containing protein n=1 Tax=Lachnospira eligens TaxID=39485 RepID=A0A175A379_9FIRM|nr:triple tyrosine motif-containing protein [Lachnospira eligens]
MTFTAEAAGGKEGYTYKFIVYNKTTGTWGLVQNYSSKNICTWTKGSAGDRYFYVDVKDAAGNVVRSEALNVKIEATAPKVTLTGSSETVNAGAKLTLTAQTTLGSGCTYKFIIFNPATNQWFKLQDFSSSNTFTWTAGSDGTRLFYVDVKDADGNVTRSKALNVTIGNGSANWLSVKATVSSNTSKTGDKITFTAEGVGGKAGYTYKMVVYNKTTKIWGLVQNFSSNNTITWIAGTTGDREFYIDVKDADGNVARSAVMNVTTTK